MAILLRKTVTRTAPDGTEPYTRKGEHFGRWTDRRGRTRTAPLVVDDAGMPIQDKAGRYRIRTKSNTVYAKLRIGGVVRVIATGCRTEDAARSVLSDLSRRAEHIQAGILTNAEARIANHQTSPIQDHFDAFDEHLQAKICTPHYRDDIRGRLRRMAIECGFTRLGELDREQLES